MTNKTTNPMDAIIDEIIEETGLDLNQIKESYEEFKAEKGLESGGGTSIFDILESGGGLFGQAVTPDKEPNKSPNQEPQTVGLGDILANIPPELKVAMLNGSLSSLKSIASKVRGFTQPNESVSEEETSGYEKQQAYGCGAEDCACIEEDMTGIISFDKYQEHYAFAKVLNYLAQGRHVLITGAEGSGKYELAKELLGFKSRQVDGEEEVFLITDLDDSEIVEEITELGQKVGTIIATMESKSMGQALDNLNLLAGNDYENQFGVVVEMKNNFKTEGYGINKVTILIP